ncbi:vesicle-associated membrane protein-associated protein B-like [Dysidea avara]|uniref:vesicle-associated membrane protein-associated protein B-like n=1 Tax=Dysidea avara TaxID=196820 RepID=UPI00331820C1
MDRLLLLEPSKEVRFQGPYTEIVTSYMKLTNPTDKRVGYKVKTNAPRQYTVEPNNGILEPNQLQVLSIRLQPLRVPNTSTTYHKFMVQSMVVPDSDVKSEDLWRGTHKADVIDYKFNCILEAEQIQNGIETSPEHMQMTSPISNHSPINIATLQTTKLNNVQGIPKTNGISSMVDKLKTVVTEMKEMMKKSDERLLQMNNDSSKETRMLSEKLKARESESAMLTQEVTTLKERLQQVEEESKRQISLLTDKLQAQEAQFEQFRTTTVQQMSEKMEEILKQISNSETPTP